MKPSLSGTWKLVSLEHRGTDGSVTRPFGTNVQGRLTYTPRGFMSVSIMRADRTAFAGGELLEGSDAEKTKAAESYISYCGSYEIRATSVIHHIEMSLFPNWTGTTQTRFFEAEGTRLKLSSPPFREGGVERTAHLVWERL